MTTAILTDDACLRHETGACHPEKPERLEKVTAALRKLAASRDDISFIPVRAAQPEQIMRAHDKKYVERVIASAPSEGLCNLDEDTKMSPGSLNAILYATGAVCQAVDLVMSGEADNVFAAIRPPGHHACYDHSMGFCIFNNVAIAAAHALHQHGLQRVAIIDFDVHHGNGTQDIVERHLKTVGFASIQEAKLWPYNDAAQISNDTILNIGIPREAPATAWHAALQNRVLPFLRAYNPQLLIISAGFDAHRDDPPSAILFNDPPGKQNLLNDDYTRMTNDLLDLAAECCEGRVISCLEGGYNTDILASAAAAHVGTLADYPQRLSRKIRA